MHTVSQSADQENFLAADEWQINLYNLHRQSEESIFNMVDLERTKDKLQMELITNARFKPDHGTVFLYTTTSGNINVCDVRERSDFHKRPSVCFDAAVKNIGAKGSAFTKWTNSVSEARFVGDHQLVSRDYMTVKLWDIRTAPTSQGDPVTKSVYSAQVSDYMERNLTVLMEQDCLDDQFFVDVTPDGKHLATGGYNKSAHVIDINATSNTVVPCHFGAARDSPAGKLKIYNKQKRLVTLTQDSKVDMKKAVNIGCWCPKQSKTKQQTLAIVFRNCIYLYHSAPNTPAPKPKVVKKKF